MRRYCCVRHDYLSEPRLGRADVIRGELGHRLRTCVHRHASHALSRPCHVSHATCVFLIRSLVDNASQWKDVLQDAATGIVLLIVLDSLRVTRNRVWFEEYADFVSVQSMLFAGATRNWWQQTAMLVRYQNRVQE